MLPWSPGFGAWARDWQPRFSGFEEGAVLQLTFCFHHNTFRLTIVTIHSPVAKPGVPCMASFPNMLSTAQLSQSSRYHNRGEYRLSYHLIMYLYNICIYTFIYIPFGLIGCHLMAACFPSGCVMRACVVYATLQQARRGLLIAHASVRPRRKKQCNI